MSASTDLRIAEQVREALEKDSVDALAIEVSVTDGVVELSGEVPTHAERLAATTLACRFVPRPQVRSLLTVAPSGRFHHLTDEEVRTGVAAAIASAAESASAIRFEVVQHVVTIHGVLPDDHTRARIRHRIAAVPGVHIVHDRTTAEHPDPTRESS